MLGALTFFSTKTNAIDPSETLSELHHTRWTAQEGVPAGVQCLAQSSDGYLWLGANATAHGDQDNAEGEQHEECDEQRNREHWAGTISRDAS